MPQGYEATHEWYRQEEDYTYDGSFSPQTGNFTQIVWKYTRKVGFGFAMNDQGRIYVVSKQQYNFTSLRLKGEKYQIELILKK